MYGLNLITCNGRECIANWPSPAKRPPWIPARKSCFCQKHALESFPRMLTRFVHTNVSRRVSWWRARRCVFSQKSKNMQIVLNSWYIYIYTKHKHGHVIFWNLSRRRQIRTTSSGKVWVIPTKHMFARKSVFEKTGNNILKAVLIDVRKWCS